MAETFVKINQAKDQRVFTCLRPGLWRFLLYSSQDTLLPCLNPSPTIPTTPFVIEELTINGVYFKKKDSLAALGPGDYCQIEQICYFILPGYLPAWMYHDAGVYSIGRGFTTGKSLFFQGVLYQGGLDYYPVIRETADNLEAARMHFASETVTLDNSDGLFDAPQAFFGSAFQVFLRNDNDNLVPLQDYYVKNIKTRLDKASLLLGDRRERPSDKIPGEKFTLDRYPAMQNQGRPDQKSNKTGANIPEAYGYCQNIPAVCVDPYEVYLPGTATVKDYRTFKAARTITRLDRVLVKMTQPGTGGEVWTDHTASAIVNGAEGSFTLNRSYCMPSFSVDSGNPHNVPEVYDVVCSGIFNPQEYPADIIGDLISRYGGLSFDGDNYNLAEYHAELSPGLLKPIGMYFDQEIDLFEAIEKIQNAGVYSFQFRSVLTAEGKPVFTAKRNDNQRPVSRTISPADLLNINEIEIDMNAQEYATVIDVAYAENHLDDKNRDDNYEHIVDRRNQNTNLRIFRVEKKYNAVTGLHNKTHAMEKADRLTEYFSKTRPLILGVKLFGLEWFSLNIYDIVEIDLRNEDQNQTVPRWIQSFLRSSGELSSLGIENAGHIVRLSDFTGPEKTVRNFIGKVTCKITGIEKNTKTETVTLDLVYIGPAGA
jgi:hypothetical protein